MSGPLAVILEVGESILTAAEADDWSRVESLQRERWRRLTMIDWRPSQPAAARALIDDVVRLQEQNRVLTDLAEAERGRRAAQLVRARIGRRASRAYGGARA